MSVLYEFQDGSKLRLFTAKDLICIPIWNGNRILDEGHKAEILKNLKTIQDLEQQPYRVVRYKVDSESEKQEYATVIVDGQHRASIIRDYFAKEGLDAKNFGVLVIEKHCESEHEIHEYFKILNKTKAIDWKGDEILQTNPFVSALEKSLNADPKKPLIRQGTTKKPYVSVEDVRKDLLKRQVYLGSETPEEYACRITRLHSQNLRELNEIDMDDLSAAMKTARKAQCVLGYMIGVSNELNPIIL